MTTKEQFTKAYLSAMGWVDTVVVDPNLAFHYPACVYSFENRRILTLAEEFADAKEELDASLSLRQVLETLFDMQHVHMTAERVIGYYAALPVLGEKMPPIPDDERLTALQDAMEEDDWLRGQVSAQDDYSCCLLDQAGIAAAAGAVCDGQLADVSVCVRPDCRGSGLGARVVSSLMAKAQADGKIPVYRVESINLPSVRLAERLGLARGFVMDGALVEFEEAL